MSFDRFVSTHLCVLSGLMKIEFNKIKISNFNSTKQRVKPSKTNNNKI